MLWLCVVMVDLNFLFACDLNMNVYILKLYILILDFSTFVHFYEL